MIQDVISRLRVHRGTTDNWMHTARWVLMWISNWAHLGRLMPQLGIQFVNGHFATIKDNKPIKDNKNGASENMTGGYYVFTYSDSAQTDIVEIRSLEQQIQWLRDDFSRCL